MKTQINQPEEQNTTNNVSRENKGEDTTKILRLYGRLVGMSTQIKEPALILKKQTPDILAFAINEYKMDRTEQTVKGGIKT